MKHTLNSIALAAGLACSSAQAWGPGDTGGGEPPSANLTFEQGAQPQCFSPGDFWDEFFPHLACGYVPPAKPPTEWAPKPTPPSFVPSPPVPEPGSAALFIAGIGILWFWRRGRKALTTGATPRKED